MRRVRRSATSQRSTAGSSGREGRSTPRSPGVSPTRSERRLAGSARGIAAAAAVAALLLGPQDAGAASGLPLRVLFLGNSLTYTHDVPGLVAAMARGSGGRPIEVGSVTAPNAALEDLWATRRARREVASGDWDVVVMQQGPSSLQASRVHLVEWSGRIAAAAREAGAVPVLYGVWPSASRDGFFPDVVESYRVAAEACGCGLAPVGAVWRAASTRDPGLVLRGPDGFHPSPEGAWLAALTLWATLTGEDPLLVPDRLFLGDGSTVGISAGPLGTFRDVVHTTLPTAGRSLPRPGEGPGAGSATDLPRPR